MGTRASPEAAGGMSEDCAPRTALERRTNPTTGSRCLNSVRMDLARLAGAGVRPGFSRRWKAHIELRVARSNLTAGGRHPALHGLGGSRLMLDSSRCRPPEMAKTLFGLGSLLQPDHWPEGSEGADKQAIAVIRAGLAQADPPETLGPRSHKGLASHIVVHVASVLAPVDFRPRSTVIRAFGRPALQIIVISSPDRVVRWLDADSLEVPASPGASSSSVAQYELMFPKSAAFGS
jgi:hypothetical protein